MSWGSPSGPKKKFKSDDDGNSWGGGGWDNATDNNESKNDGGWSGGWGNSDDNAGAKNGGQQDNGWGGGQQDNGWGGGQQDNGWGGGQNHESSGERGFGRGSGRGGGFGRGAGRGGGFNRDGGRGGGRGGGFGRGAGRGGGGWNSSNDDYGSRRDNRRDSGWGGSRDNNDQQSEGGWGSSSGGGGGGGGGGGDGGWGSTNDNQGSSTGESIGGWGCSNDQPRSRNNGGGGDGGGGWGTSNDNRSPRKGGFDSSDNNRRGRFGDNDDSRRESIGDNNGEERPAPYKPQDVDLAEEAQLVIEGAGENFHRYREQVVTCLPLGLVEPIEKFSDVIESELLLKNLNSCKYSEMTPIQKWAIPAILNGHDIIGCAQTGSGKTAAFLLPVLQKILKIELDTHDPDSDCQNPYCLIISPTRELARQIHVQAELLARDSIIRCRVIYGQISTHHLKAKLSTGCHILVATPGRLKDFVGRGWIGFKNIKFVILDEGDRLADDGFSGDLKEIFNQGSMPPIDQRQTLFFSATFKQDIQQNAKKYLKESFIFMTVGKVGAANEDIKQEFIKVERAEKKRTLKKILDGVPETDKTIIFTQTKHIADILAGYLTTLNLSSTSIHGDRHQSQRDEAISLFKRGLKKFLISSPVGNRGLDLPKVSLVINYDLPDNVDEYVHRIGRTGRAGRSGRAISFVDMSKDQPIFGEMMEMLKEAKQEIPDWMTSEGSAGDMVGMGASDDWGTSTTAAPAGESGGTWDKADDWGSTATGPNTTVKEPHDTADDWGGSTAGVESATKPKDGATSSGSDWAEKPSTEPSNDGDANAWGSW